MSASLVGSEMCIRDRDKTGRQWLCMRLPGGMSSKVRPRHSGMPVGMSSCLLYTSDAADDM
eukprot:4759678-Alexandrium_andersonii.AAC.1